MRFEESVEFKGDAAEVWTRASNVRDIPTYWHGTRSLEVVREDGGVTHAKVVFGFGGSGEADISKDTEQRLLTIDYTSGPVTGRQTVRVSQDRITAVWDIKFRGAFRLAEKGSESHLRSGTVHALERLAGQAPKDQRLE